ncbi:response regulator transcription factor [Angustibacter luteus]|uniref:Response regulator transcription factor n=1 Tax=Angustibacter luteus TaxID=658456 RepID=A0ABW1JAH7_9ACTN
MPTVLVADDDPTVSQVVCDYLRRAGITPVPAVDGAAALAIVRREQVDVAVLDVMMGPPDGLEVCRRLRADPLTSLLPIILLTALGDEIDRIAGFETGADDYVTKPFSPRELLLRVQALLRRSAPDAGVVGTTLASGDLVVDTAARVVTRAGQRLQLTTRELDLLAFLVEHPGQVFSREVLMHRVWGWSFGDDSTVTVHVRRLREKVEDDPSAPTRLVTVWGAGYRWDEAA